MNTTQPITGAHQADHQGVVYSMLRYQLHYSFAIAQGASDAVACQVAGAAMLDNSNDKGRS